MAAKLTIELPQPLALAVETSARWDGLTVSEWLTLAARAQLRREAKRRRAD